MSSEKLNHTDSKDISDIKNKGKKSHINQSLKITNEEFATELGIDDNSTERNPVSERSAWN
ncbi:hypothetical protein [Paenibacillus endoradicis]|uniref:hypothetical protein n=1 Tax=Paenibacillus endoradicis TaxID=2972487 RepID=UPI002158DF35|nr:hypothetical protein [Paenibacillus endoradicis]MCR8657386.1 hypothetical protein [Paenibacillus endoradicis]